MVSNLDIESMHFADNCSAAFHKGLAMFKQYLSSLIDLETQFKSQRFLEIIDSFSHELHSHLAAEPLALLALSRFASPERQFDLVEIEHTEGKKMVNLDFLLNVLPIFFNNSKHSLSICLVVFYVPFELSNKFHLFLENSVLILI